MRAVDGAAQGARQFVAEAQLGQFPQPIATGQEPDDGLLSALRDSTRDSEGHDSNEGPLSNGVGSIQIVRPSREAVIEPPNVADASLHDNGPSAARGIAVSVASGIGFRSLIGGLIRFFIF